MKAHAGEEVGMFRSSRLGAMPGIRKWDDARDEGAP